MPWSGSTPPSVASWPPTPANTSAVSDTSSSDTGVSTPVPAAADGEAYTDRLVLDWLSVKLPAISTTLSIVSVTLPPTATETSCVRSLNWVWSNASQSTTEPSAAAPLARTNSFVTV